MQDFLIALLICSLTMSVVAVLYMACMPLLSRRYSEKWRYYIWLVIVIALIIPFRPSLDNAIVTIELPATEPIPYGVIFFAETIEERIAIEEAVLQSHSRAQSIPWWQIAFWVWLVGAIAFFGYHVIRHLHFMKAVRRWREEVTDSRILAMLEDIKLEMGINMHVSLYVCPFGSPMVVGILNPVIFLPTTDIHPDELRFIIQHELVHYKRKDLLYKYLVMLATALHWFNPVVHFMAGSINLHCEMSCDAEVVQDYDSDTRQSYSEALIGVVRYQTKLKTSLSTNFYRGKNGMKSRISAIADIRKKRAGVIIACVVAVLTIGSGFVFSAAPVVVQFESTEADTHSDMQLFIYLAEDAPLEGVNVIATDPSPLWGTPPDRGERIVIMATRPMHSVLLYRFEHYHDRTTSEDLFMITDWLGIADVINPDEALLLHNFSSPYYMSILSFYDSWGERHFYSIMVIPNDNAPPFIGTANVTSQVWFE